MNTWEYKIGHVLDVLATMEDQSIHCCITSPPYWGLRDYGIDPVIWGGIINCDHIMPQLREGNIAPKLPPGNIGGVKSD